MKHSSVVTYRLKGSNKVLHKAFATASKAQAFVDTLRRIDVYNKSLRRYVTVQKASVDFFVQFHLTHEEWRRINPSQGMGTR